MEFKRVPFSQVLSNVVDNRGKTCPTSPSGIPLIATNCIRNENLYPLRESLRFVDQSTYESWFRGHPKPGDLLFVTKGTPGRVCLTPDPVDFCIAQDMVAIRADITKIDPNYLLAVLRSQDVQCQIKNMHVGTMIPHFKKGDFPNLLLPIPNKGLQRQIGNTYRTLSDKIELNRRMNDTLESLARALFKSWFVDFDPVRAKMDGRQPHGMDKATADLFPDELVDSPIGMIPRGWKVDRFDQHILADRGLSYNGDGLRTDQSGLPMHNLNSIYEGGSYKHEGIKFYGGDFRDKHLLEPGDMIVTNTEQGFDSLLIGYAAIVPQCFGPRGLFSHHIYRVRIKDGSPFSTYYLVELFNCRRWHSWISGFANGTTINMLPMDALELPQLVVPPRKLINQFTALAETTHATMEGNKQQTKILASLRDTLLSKLLSGELRVPEAERLAEEVL